MKKIIYITFATCFILFNSCTKEAVVPVVEPEVTNEVPLTKGYPVFCSQCWPYGVVSNITGQCLNCGYQHTMDIGNGGKGTTPPCTICGCDYNDKVTCDNCGAYYCLNSCWSSVYKHHGHCAVCPPWGYCDCG